MPYTRDQCTELQMKDLQVGQYIAIAVEDTSSNSLFDALPIRGPIHRTEEFVLFFAIVTHSLRQAIDFTQENQALRVHFDPSTHQIASVDIMFDRKPDDLILVLKQDVTPKQ